MFYVSKGSLPSLPVQEVQQQVWSYTRAPVRGQEAQPPGTHRPLSRPTPHTRMLTMGCEWSTVRSMGSTRLSVSFSRIRYMSFPWNQREPVTLLPKHTRPRHVCCRLGCPSNEQKKPPRGLGCVLKGEAPSPE